MKPTVLITGASSGIGYELARVFARHGYDVVAVARTEARLNEVSEELQRDFGARCHVIPLDLAQPGAADRLSEALDKQQLRIDVLINNAGFGAHGLFASTDLATELEMMQLNMTALVHLTKLFLRKMVQEGGGRILNVASTAAFQPGPKLAIYYATKAFVVSFSQAIAAEVAGSGVTVSVLCPGPTRTRFQERADMKSMPMFAPFFLRNADMVAAVAYRDLMRGKRLIIPGVLNKLGVFAVRFLPRNLVVSIVQGLHERRTG